jgi:hypothetical protein
MCQLRIGLTMGGKIRNRFHSSTAISRYQLGILSSYWFLTVKYRASSNSRTGGKSFDTSRAAAMLRGGECGQNKGSLTRFACRERYEAVSIEAKLGRDSRQCRKKRQLNISPAFIADDELRAPILADKECPPRERVLLHCVQWSVQWLHHFRRP